MLRTRSVVSPLRTVAEAKRAVAGPRGLGQSCESPTFAFVSSSDSETRAKKVRQSQIIIFALLRSLGMLWSGVLVAIPV